MGRALPRLAGLLAALAMLPAAAAGAVTTSPSVSGAGASGSLGGGLTSPGGAATTSTASPTVISTSTAASGSSGLSGTSAIAIALGAVLVIGGISFYIWRDARRRAPAPAHRGPDYAGGTRPGSKAPPKARKLSAAERKRRKRGRARR